MCASIRSRSTFVIQNAFWPVMTILTPLVVIGLYWIWLPSIIVDADWSHLSQAKKAMDPVALMARDVGGRIQFGIASALLYIVSSASIVLAHIVVAGRFGTTGAIRLAGIVVVAASILALRAYSESEDHVSLIRRALDQIKIVALAPEPFHIVDIAIRCNLVASRLLQPI
jgi:hypothetical protein